MTKPYYQDDQVTLYHGDCLGVDDWLAADVLVTDPPYGIGWSKGLNKAANSRAHSGIVNDGDTAYRDNVLTMWGDEKPAIVFGSHRASYPKGVNQTLTWKKPADAGVVGSVIGYRTDTELIFLLGNHQRRNASRSSVLDSKGGMHRYLSGHPHAKPVGILEQLIEWTDGVVADPFAGSGSTLIAARNVGQRAIGVEIDEGYCELIAKRLDQMCIDFGDAQ